MQSDDDVVDRDTCTLGLRRNIILVGIGRENFGTDGRRRRAVLESKVCRGQRSARENARIGSARRARVWYCVGENLDAPRDPLGNKLEAADRGRGGRLVKIFGRYLSE